MGLFTGLRKAGSQIAASFSDGSSLFLPKSTNWKEEPYVVTNFTGNASMVWTVGAPDLGYVRFSVIDRTMFLYFKIENSSVSGTPSSRLRIAVPGGYKTTTEEVRMACGYANVNGAGTEPTWASNTESSNTVDIFRYTGNWAASTNDTDVGGFLIFPVSY